MRTERGRVVYDRPKHHFSYKDLLRIAKSLDSEDFDRFLEEIKVEVSEVVKAHIKKTLITDLNQLLDFLETVLKIIPGEFGFEEYLFEKFIEEVVRPTLDARVDKIIDDIMETI